MPPTILMAIVAIVFFLFVILAVVLRRYRRCPSDKILVVYGKVGGKGRRAGMSARCYHGGAAFIWPIFQAYKFLDLKPMQIDINLQGALSLQNIRVNTPSTFTVGISTEPGVMENAAERLLDMNFQQTADLARDIIFGQMRVVMATMPIEEINADRDKLIENITNGVEGELKKVGLRLINVNIQDITDESGYIDALGRDAAARAINEAKVKVAEKERDGEIGAAAADRDRRIQVSQALATAVEGENEAKVTIANSNASRREQEAEAERKASAAEKVKNAQALEEAYKAEEGAERQRAQREEATQRANVLVAAEIKKSEIETLAEAEAERIRRLKKGEADGLRFNMQAQADGTLFQRKAEADGTKLQMTAEADGLRAKMLAEAEGLIEILQNKAEGFRRIVESVAGDTEQAALLLVTEQLPQLVEEQVKAIANLKIDNVTVWEGGRGGGNGEKTATADFLSGLVGSLPPLHELTKNVGVQLPEYLGRMGGKGGHGKTAHGQGGREPGAANPGPARGSRRGAASGGDDGEDDGSGPSGGRRSRGGRGSPAAKPGPAPASRGARQGLPGPSPSPVGSRSPEPSPSLDALQRSQPLTGYGGGAQATRTAEKPERPEPEADALASPATAQEAPAEAAEVAVDAPHPAEAPSAAEPAAATGEPAASPAGDGAERPGATPYRQLRAWLAGHPDLLGIPAADIASGKADPALDAAAEAAFEWASRRLDPAAVWFHAENRQWVGPERWDEVVAAAKKRPKLAVNLDRKGLWLPFRAIERAVESLR